MRELQPCGTWAAYKAHLKRAEKPCEPCNQASRARAADYYAKNRAEVSARNAARARANRGPTARVRRDALCELCRSEFSTVIQTQRFCAGRCRDIAARRRSRGTYTKWRWALFPAVAFLPDGTRKASRVDVQVDEDGNKRAFCPPCGVLLGWNSYGDEMRLWCFKCDTSAILADDPF